MRPTCSSVVSLAISAVLLAPAPAAPPAVAAQSMLDTDTRPVTIEDEAHNKVPLYIPQSLATLQGERQLYGTADGIVGLFRTLHQRGRREEAYLAAIRDVVLQPGLQPSIEEARAALDEREARTSGAATVFDLIDLAPTAIRMRYVRGATPAAVVANNLRTVARRANAIKKYHGLSKACLALDGLGLAIKLDKFIVATVLFQALVTDLARERLALVREVLEAERAAGGVDPALMAALSRAEDEIVEAQSVMGEFVEALNREVGAVVDVAIDTAGVILKIAASAAHLGAKASIWIAGALWTYDALRGISNQWELAQNATCMATLATVLDAHQPAADLASYGRWAFYGLLERAFSTGGAKWADVVTTVVPVRARNSDWAGYYRDRKQAVLAVWRARADAQTAPANGTGAAPAGAPAFEDGFDSSLDGWLPWGSPRPAWVTSSYGRSGLFDNRGDGSYDSGAVSKRTFDISGGFVLESDVYVRFDNPAGCWNTASIGMTRGSYDAAHDQHHAAISLMLTAVGDACWATAPARRRHGHLDAYYLGAQGMVAAISERRADQYMNGWHRLRISVSPALLPSFSVDGEVVFTGTVPLSTLIAARPQSIVLGARSSGSAGRSYHDWVRWTR